MEKVEVNAKGIKNRLKSVKPYKAIAEYIWNGFDAGANTLEINYEANEVGDIHYLEIKDNGRGIPKSQLINKFKPVLSSEKRDNEVQHTLIHGKNGLGRLTFYHFAQKAKWTTNYMSNNKIHGYSIEVDEAFIDKYKEIDDKQHISEETGTTVSFTNIFDLNEYYIRSVLLSYLEKEFSWFLELNKDNGFQILINKKELPYKKLINDRETLEISTDKFSFEIQYIRWSNKLNRHFSRIYCQDLSNAFKYSKPTTLNNKGDEFYHSVFVRSEFFKDFKCEKKSKQGELLNPNNDKSPDFKQLIKSINAYLSDKRKPFIVSYAKSLVEEYEKQGVFPEINPNNRWEKMRSDDIKEAVKQLYQVDPRILSNLNLTQKKTFVSFIAMIIDGGEVDDLFKILDSVTELSSSEREVFARQLNTTKLSSIVRTIELISDRFKSVSEFKKLVFDESMYAGEVPHLQKMMEKNYWLIGEEYQLLTAAEPDFEEALRRHLHILHGEKDKVKIEHKDKNREMDLFLVRQGKRNNTIENIVIELKHPKNVRLGKKEYDQLYDYFQVIKSEPRFNGENMKWTFYLIGNKFDTSGFLKSQMRNLRGLGQPGLVFEDDEYKMFAFTWSEIFTEFEIKHNFLNEKLQLQLAKLVPSVHASADDIVTQKKSSDSAPELKIAEPA